MAMNAAETGIVDRVTQSRNALLDDLAKYVGVCTLTGLLGGEDDLEAGADPAADGRGGIAWTRLKLVHRLVKIGGRAEVIPGLPAPAWLTPRGKPGPAAPPPTIVVRCVIAGRPNVLVSGHLDTVHPPGKAFSKLTISTDRITATGPGCVDMKGGLVIAVHALETLHAAGLECGWSFILNSDEETGSFSSDAALRAEASRLWPDGSKVYAAGLALEPAMSKGELAIERGGSGQVCIQAHGKAAHVGRDFASGVSAVDALCRAIVAAHECSDAPRAVCVNFSPLECDLPPNIVADLARAWGNLRYPTPQDGVRLAARLAALERGTDGTLPRLAVQSILNRPAKPLTPDTERLGLLARAAAEDLGQKLPFGKSAGVCDGNNLQAAGLPTIDTMGVRGGGLHTDQEWIEIASLVERCSLLAVTIMRLTAHRSPLPN